jgi:hypothetical protein
VSSSGEEGEKHQASVGGVPLRQSPARVRYVAFGEGGVIAVVNELSLSSEFPLFLNTSVLSLTWGDIDQHWCYGLNVSPSNPHVETLTPSCSWK